jgi:ParB family chromosome partitioning protein
MAKTSFVLPLGSLHFGHEAVPPINARRTDRESEIEALSASLQAHGQIAPLSVTRIDGTWYVADGNRRLAALRHLAEQDGVWGRDVICTEIDGDAGEISLAANVMRMPLHEADSLETFRGLADKGMSEAAIAARFGIPATRVRRILAIGSLSPVILDAWREGRFGDQAVASVRAFTLARDHAHQEEVFARLEKHDRLMPHFIREALGAGSRRAGQLLAFIGREAYRVAGGAVTEDLFGDNHVISDVALAEQLAAAKLEEGCEALLAQGWKWARPAEDLAPNWRYSWQRLTPGTTRANPQENKRLKALRTVAEDEAAGDDARREASAEIKAIEEKVAARGWSAAQKAEAGCVVDIGPKGELSVTLGLVDPAHAKKAAKAKAAEPGGEAPAPKEAAISAALVHRLSVQATLGLREALAEDPRLGLVTLLAGFLTVDFYNQPIRVRHEGYGRTPVRDGDSFRDVFARLSAMTEEELHQVAAGIAAAALDLTTHNPLAPPLRGGNGVLAAALDPARLHTALAGQFDAQDYFGSAPKALALRAITEALNEDEARKAAKLGKADLVAFAVANVPPTGWLPPELRSATYAGPGALPTPSGTKAPSEEEDDFADEEADGEDLDGRDDSGEFDDEQEAA